VNRLVVLVSGSGTNLAAILDACASGALDAEVVAVVSNRPGVLALDRARAAGVEAVVVERLPAETRPAFDRRLVDAVAPRDPDLVVLAGWMRILTPTFIDRFPVINLHPALPGTFPGAHAIDDAYAAWSAGTVDRSGVMVHWVVDAGVDDGPVILAEPVAFEPGDTRKTFEARIHAAEHRVLVDAIEIALSSVAP
jgi:formyltetrahydrofolate-dependent phosphoribosylglycinamide formyltransferase